MATEHTNDLIFSKLFAQYPSAGKHIGDLLAAYRAAGFTIVGQPLDTRANQFWHDITFAVTKVEDTFTAADATPIGGRIASPVAGTSAWSETKGASTIVGNKFKALNNGANDTETWINSGVADCTITCDVARATGGYGGLMYRAIGTSGNQEYFYLPNSTSWALGSAGSGGVGTWASGAGTFTDGVEYQLKVVLLGTNIKAYIDGVLKADVTSTSTYTTNTKHGVLGILGGTFDNFKVVQ